MVNFGALAAEIGLVVWGTPANFNGFCVLATAALLHGTPEVGVSQTLRPPRWALAHILVIVFINFPLEDVHIGIFFSVLNVESHSQLISR